MGVCYLFFDSRCNTLHLIGALQHEHKLYTSSLSRRIVSNGKE